MKKLLLCLCAVLLLTSCDGDDGMEYKDPNLYRYDDYYEDSEDNSYETGYLEGFYEGYDQGFNEIENAVEEAIDYAEYFHPEEAMWIIEMYQTKVSYYPDGSLPTKEEYRQAIDSLIDFYEYFYNCKYENNYDPIQ